jgi:hypothetical protein
MTFAIIKTSAGYMVLNQETDEFVNDEHGDNTFDDIKDAERILDAIKILSALGDKPKPKRPSKKAIAHAFGHHLTVDVKGYEETAWDILNWQDIDDLFLFLQDYVEMQNVGAHSDYEHMHPSDLEHSIVSMAWGYK